MAILHTTLATQPVDENKISDADKVVRSYIEKYGNISYDAVIAGESDWQIFYNLSELRTGILSWYDFKPQAEVLEIGAGFGALTGRLCSLCAHVTATERALYRAEAIVKRYEALDNLEVYAGDIAELEFDRSFDYIVLVGLLERVGNGASNPDPYAAYLKSLQKWLKPGGKILLAVENRFGLKYFCGAPEPHTNRAFDGLNHYAQGTSGYSFSRQEMGKIVEQAGFQWHRFYYPLPDYKLPQLVYTDEYLPEKNLKERLIPYYRRSDTLVAEEQELYDDIVTNGVFPFFANSFLVECGEQGGPGQVLYAAVSTDRGEERSFATTIRKDGMVRKAPLYQKGRVNGEKLYECSRDLLSRGIPVVEHKMREDGSLDMPYVPWPTLSNYIKSIMKDRTERVLQLIDRIYGYILQSSEQVATECNELLKRQLAAAQSREERERLQQLDFGPVLKKAYMELITLNCFFNEETDEFLYFDQEFVRENYPAKFVLFRAIHYIYCFTPGAEQACPLESLKVKYGMEDTWDIYLQEEIRFQSEVRKWEQYSQFYRWTQVDRNRLAENAKRLASEEEIVAEYKISHKMKQIWKVELAMLDEVDRICKKYDLTYFLVHGSLLGAVRHKGFIPWDDDLDIAMLRTDYDRFLEVAPRELKEPLSIHTFRTEKDIFWGGFARIRNGQTTGIEAKELGHKGNLGIWIDLLPLDNCTPDEKKLLKKERRIRHCHRLLYAKIYGGEYRTFMDLSDWKWRLYRLLAACCSHDRLGGMLEKAMRMYTAEKSEEVAVFTGYDKHRRLYAGDFADTAQLEFEHRKVPVPVGYENYLFMTLGRDYLKYPPEEERKPKHRGVFDPDVPYERYTHLLGDTFEGVKGKKIILFGAGLMFEDYMKKYGDKYKPAFLVDNDENKWGRFRMGVEICGPEAILEVPEEKRRLIICSFYYREIAEQLENMGIRDYKVYVQEIEWIVQSEGQR